MDVSGTITKVRVFIDRAAVTRRVTIAAGEGLSSQINVAPVPLDVETDTLRASAQIEGESGVQTVKVTGVSSEVIFADQETERQKEIRKELEEFETSADAVEDAASTEQHAMALLRKYAQISTRKLSLEWLDQNPTFDKWNVTFDHLRRTASKLAAARASRALEKSKLQLKRIALLEEERRLGRPDKLGYRVTIALDLPADASGTLSVDLTYITRKAQWMPCYDVRHSEGMGSTPERVALTAIGLVRQVTGEDWEDIELIATTARPPLAESPPELNKISVSGFQGTEDKQVVSTSRIEERLHGAADSPPDQMEQALVEHVAQGKVSIPSTNHPVRVELFEGDLPSSSRLEVAPMARPVAILVAELVNRTGRVLLPGKVNIFRGANYSGQSQIGFVSGTERFRLPLGTDASLRIKRDTVARPETKTAITGSVNYLYEYKTVIENVSGESVNVLVRDRIPVSRTEQTSVKVTEMDRSMEIDSETGLTSLKLTVAARSKREITTVFKVTAPRGFTVAPPREI